MRSPAVRLLVGAFACLAIAAAAFFIFKSRQELTGHRAAVRAFDLHAREATDALAELRAAQQAYVAAGQGVAFWMPKVAATADRAATLVAGLRGAATSAAAKSALDGATTGIAEFGTVDKRARDYIASGQQLMAADVVFTEGGDTSAAAARQVEEARLAEHQTLDAVEAAAQKLEATAAGASAAIAVLAILLLLPAGRVRAEPTAAVVDGTLGLSAPPRAPEAKAASASGASARAISPILKAAAQLCTEFGRVKDAEGVAAALARAADLMDASGLIVWLGSTTGADLQPALAHGYSAQMLARMPAVPRSADNAAAAAYRTGAMQIVMARPGTASGAIVAPLLSADGCIGALSAEIAGGGEGSDSVQALAAIFAAQLAGVLSTAGSAEPAQTKTASA